jgi:hypothetical protein
VLDGRGAELVAELLVHRLAGIAVVPQYPHLDQAVGVEGGVGFLLHGGREPVVADHHDRVEVMGFGPMRLALGYGQLDRWHPRIIRCRRTRT